MAGKRRRSTLRTSRIAAPDGEVQPLRQLDGCPWFPGLGLEGALSEAGPTGRGHAAVLGARRHPGDDGRDPEALEQRIRVLENQLRGLADLGVQALGHRREP